MISLVYVSAARRLLNEDELSDLLAECRYNNAARNITGMLCYADGNFMQALEGNDDVVDRLALVIEKDPRHTGMRRLIREPITERLFDKWSMAMRGIENLPLQDREISAAFIADSLSGSSAGKSSAALALLNSFHKTML